MPSITILPLLSLCKERVTQLYGKRLHQIWLYGSYARQEEKADSDIDLLIVLKDEKIKVGQEIDQLTDQLFDLILVFGKDISYLPMSKNRFETAQEPLLYFIRREGILL